MSDRIADATTDRGEVTLRRVAGALELRVNGIFVMDTAETSTERRLATAALARCARPERVLVGGLGLGFTAAEVLTDDRVAAVHVVEIEQPVIDWLSDGTVPGGPALLADPRVTVVHGEVGAHIAAASAESFDLVLLDVDNGPGNMVHAGNVELYGRETLLRLRRILRPGGTVVIWSAARAPELHQAMSEVFAEVDEEPLAVQLQDRDERYWLYSGGSVGAENRDR